MARSYNRIGGRLRAVVHGHVAVAVHAHVDVDVDPG